MKELFVVVRVLAGLASTTALLLLSAIVLLRSGLAFAKEGVGVLGYVGKLFTSGFTEGTPPKSPVGWVVSLPQAGLAILFVSMIVSVFLPGAKLFLHLVTVMAGLAVIWYVRMLLTEVTLEIFCLPLIAVWLCFYAMGIFWSGNQPVDVSTPPLLELGK